MADAMKARKGSLKCKECGGTGIVPIRVRPELLAFRGVWRWEWDGTRQQLLTVRDGRVIERAPMSYAAACDAAARYASP